MVQTLQRKLKLFIFGLMPPCKEITLLASKAIDTKISLRERLHIRLHILLCKGCHRFYQQIHFLHTIIHHQHAPGHEHSSPFSATLSEASKQRLKDAISSSL